MTRLFGARKTPALSPSRFYLRSILIYLSLQNAVEKMRSLALVLASCLNLLQIVVHCQELSVIRHSDGDIFTIEGKICVYSIIVLIIIIVILICERTKTFDKSRQSETMTEQIALGMR